MAHSLGRVRTRLSARGWQRGPAGLCPTFPGTSESEGGECGTTGFRRAEGSAPVVGQSPTLGCFLSPGPWNRSQQTRPGGGRETGERMRRPPTLPRGADRERQPGPVTGPRKGPPKGDLFRGLRACRAPSSRCARGCRQTCTEDRRTSHRSCRHPRFGGLPSRAHRWHLVAVLLRQPTRGRLRVFVPERGQRRLLPTAEDGGFRRRVIR